MGILDSAMQQPQGGIQSTAQAMPGPEPQPGQQNMPVEKAQEIQKRLGLAALKIIYTKPESDRLIDILTAGAENPPNAVATAAMAVMGRLQTEIKGINPNLAFSVAPAVVVFLIELGEAAGVIEAEVPLIQESLAVMTEMTKQQGQQQPGPQQPPEQLPPEQTPAQAQAAPPAQAAQPLGV